MTMPQCPHLLHSIRTRFQTRRRSSTCSHDVGRMTAGSALVVEFRIGFSWVTLKVELRVKLARLPLLLPGPLVPIPVQGTVALRFICILVFPRALLLLPVDGAVTIGVIFPSVVPRPPLSLPVKSAIPLHFVR